MNTKNVLLVDGPSASAFIAAFSSLLSEKVKDIRVSNTGINLDLPMGARFEIIFVSGALIERKFINLSLLKEKCGTENCRTVIMSFDPAILKEVGSQADFTLDKSEVDPDLFEGTRKLFKKVFKPLYQFHE